MDPQDNGWGALQQLSSDVKTVRVDPSTGQVLHGPDLTDPQAAQVARLITKNNGTPQTVSGEAAPTANRKNMVAAMWTTEPPETNYHEILGHGSLGRAEQTGQTGRLDTLGQLIAGAHNSNVPWLQGLGLVGDEARAYGFERAYPASQAGQSPTQQNLSEARGALGDFVFNPGRANTYRGFYRQDATKPFTRGYAAQQFGPDANNDAANVLSVTGGIGNVVSPVAQFVRAISGGGG